MTANALILIDIQNDYFTGGLWEVHKMDAVAANAARLLARARAAGDLVIHVRHEILGDNPPFFRPGSEGAEIHPSVAPTTGERVITKHKANSFIGTGLHEILTEAGITDLILCGAMSQMCIDAAARAASDLGYAVTVAEDASGAKEAEFDGHPVAAPEVHAAFMSALGMGYARVVRTAELVGEMG